MSTHPNEARERGDVPRDERATGQNEPQPERVTVVHEGRRSNAPAVTAIIAVLVVALTVIGLVAFTDVMSTFSETMDDATSQTSDEGGLEMPDEFDVNVDSGNDESGSTDGGSTDGASDEG